MPDLSEPKFSVTMIVVDHTWLYCIGGVGEYNPEILTTQTIERLNTAKLRDEDDFSHHNKHILQWERIDMPSQYQSCC